MLKLLRSEQKLLMSLISSLSQEYQLSSNKSKEQNRFIRIGETSESSGYTISSAGAALLPSPNNSLV